MEEKCKNCKFWDEDNDVTMDKDEAVCKRFPPKTSGENLRKGEPINHSNLYTVTGYFEWCGEFVEKEK
ncbi:unnamed protein product [marine sediment metagenome]|uniref:Uncharacterized protein n=1 Tax=marine sediment metagenome TaxID=412755 RepID=X1GW92_9ZZZZ